MRSTNLTTTALFFAAWWGSPAPVLAIDADGDGVDDVADVCCDTPPGTPVDESGRPLADLDGDCDVDLLDFAELQDGYTGPFLHGCCFDDECRDGDPCTRERCDTALGECVITPVEGCGECTIDASCPAELVCDRPVVGTISTVAETDTFCFCVSEGEIVRLSVTEQPGSGAAFNPVWRLLDANDNPAQDCGAALTAAAFDDCGPLPAAGSPYRLIIEDGSRNDIGAYKANLQRLLAEVVCDDIALECDIPTPGSIADTSDEDLLHFSVEGCEMVRMSVVEAVGSLTNFGPTWRLIDGGGHPSRSCGDFATAVDRDCGPLCPGGNPYRVEIEDASRNEVGDYSVNLQRLTAQRSCDATIPCGLAVQGSIDSIGDSDLLNFRVADGEIIRVSVAEPPEQPTNFNPSWRLIDGDGFPAVSCGAFATTLTGVDCGPLLSSRNPYRLEIQDGTRNDTGNYLAAYDRLPAHLACDQVELQCGVTTAGSTDSLVDIDLFSFRAPEGEVVRILVLEQAGGGVNYGPNWRLIDGSGRPAPFCGTVTTSTSLDCGPLPAARGPYGVDIEDAGHNDLGSYTVSATFLTTGCP